MPFWFPPPPPFVGGAQPFAPPPGATAALFAAEVPQTSPPVFLDRRGGGMAAGGGVTAPSTAATIYTDRRGVIAGSLTSAPADDPNSGLGIKVAVRVATTGSNVALVGLQTIDGVVLRTGDRVLVKDQADATTNGIYIAGPIQWPRAIDANSNSLLAVGMTVVAAQGTINAGVVFGLAAPAVRIVLGLSPLTFRPGGGVNPTIAFALIADGGMLLVRSGLTRQIEIPCHFTVERWTLLANVAGSVTADVWATSFAAGPPLTVANSITAGSPPVLSEALFAQGDVSWPVSAGAILGISLSSIAAISRLTLSLFGTRP